MMSVSNLTFSLSSPCNIYDVKNRKVYFLFELSLSPNPWKSKCESTITSRQWPRIFPPTFDGSSQGMRKHYSHCTFGGAILVAIFKLSTTAYVDFGPRIVFT